MTCAAEIEVMQFADEILFSLDCGLFPNEPDYEDEFYDEYEGCPLDGHDLLQYADAVDEAVKRTLQISTAT